MNFDKTSDKSAQAPSYSQHRRTDHLAEDPRAREDRRRHKSVFKQGRDNKKVAPWRDGLGRQFNQSMDKAHPPRSREGANVKDYRVQVKVQNNYLVRMMQSRGISTAAQLQRETGVTQGDIGRLMNLKIPAYTKYGIPHLFVTTLCDFFNCEVEDLFPEQHINDPLETNLASSEFNLDDLVSSHLLSAGVDPLEALMSDDRAGVIDKALDVLTSREKRVVGLRFGLDGEGEHTLKEIGNTVDLSSARVREIESNALRKLRSRPSDPELGYAHSPAAGDQQKTKVEEQALRAAKEQITTEHWEKLKQAAASRNKVRTPL